MLIKFKHIIVEGFQSIGRIELDLADRGFTLVNGVNNCTSDNAQSNGAGKSTCFNAISYALNGETIQGVSKNLVNINTTTGLLVDLTFDIDGHTFEVIRTKDHEKFGTSLKLVIDGVDRSGKGIRDTDKILADYVPELNGELLGAVIIIGQGMPQRFTGNTPSGRKEVLEKLSKSDYMIEDIKSRLTNRKIKLSSDIKEIDMKISTLNGKLSVLERQLSTSKEQLSSLEMPDQSKIEETEASLEKVRSKIAELTEEANTTRNKLTDLTQEQTSLRGEQATEDREIENKYKAELDSLQKSKYELSARISSMKSEIVKLEKVVDVCPTCGQKLPNVHKVDTTKNREELKEVESFLANIELQIKELSSRIVEEKKALAERYSNRTMELINQISFVKEELASINKTLAEYQKEETHKVSVLAELKALQRSYYDRVKELEKNIQLTESDIDKTKQEVVYNTLEREEANNRLGAITSMLTLATRDFRGFLLTNVINYLNIRAKSYCMDIFGTENVNLCLEGNNLNVTYNDKMYENLSGGEQKKVDIIIQLSIRDMLTQFSSFSSNILVLDETFEALDYVGCQKVVDVITKRLSDIESVFIITHRSNLSLPADSTITIIKDSNGVSNLA